jgi:HPt (histidine-containing phosphotransfer) domain-containing protein
VPTDDVLDAAVISELRRAQEVCDNPTFIRQLVGLFQANTPGKMDRIRGALAAGDAGAIEQTAHTLKTNCAMLGATRMADACARMESAAACADLASAARAMADAEDQFPQVLAALSSLA